jgi:pimeloyl-ACP methyl ester carboxylesterase
MLVVGEPGRDLGARGRGVRRRAQRDCAHQVEHAARDGSCDEDATLGHEADFAAMSPRSCIGLIGMSTFLLLPGAGGAARWYWRRVAAILERHGHAAIAVDLPADDPAAGLPEYAELVLAAAQGHERVVLVAQSMGAFTALSACKRLAPERLVLLNAMVPAPGETANDWWANTGWEPERIAAARAGGYAEDVDLEVYFLHDVPPDALAGNDGRDEADIAFEQPCDFAAWPAIPTTVLAGRDDRFFPLAFQRRVARERLRLDVVELPGGHLNALSEPEAVAAAVAASPPRHVEAH